MTASMGFYADADTSVRLNDYGTQRAPILNLDAPDHQLSITAFSKVPIADHLAFARALATAAAEYVAALETYAAALPSTADTAQAG